jgi:hypothetical protein
MSHQIAESPPLRRIRPARFAALVTLALGIAGCIGKEPANPAATQPATAVDEQLAQVEYWFSQPGTVSVEAGDFDALWEAAERTARDWFFQIDRRDRRSGVLSTRPLISRQFFEPWRKDAVTAADLAESSLATIRRTIRFEFTEAPGGGYAMRPKVVVERQAVPAARERGAVGGSYWYALGRDEPMEQRLAEAVRRRLGAG